MSHGFKCTYSDSALCSNHLKLALGENLLSSVEATHSHLKYDQLEVLSVLMCMSLAQVSDKNELLSNLTMQLDAQASHRSVGLDQQDLPLLNGNVFGFAKNLRKNKLPL